MKKWPLCAEDIQHAAISGLLVVGLAFLVAVALAVSACHRATPSNPPPSASLIAHADALIEKAWKTGLILGSEEGPRRVWVDPALWAPLPLDTKRAIAAAYSARFASEGQQAEAWIYAYRQDYRTDTLLASISTDGEFTLK
jgi:hypothetical protein